MCRLLNLGKCSLSQLSSDLDDNRIITSRHRVYDVGLHLKFILLILLVDLADTTVQVVEIVEPQLQVPLDLFKFACRKSLGKFRLVFFSLCSTVLLLKYVPSLAGVALTTFNPCVVGLVGTTRHEVGPCGHARNVSLILSGGVSYYR